MENLLGTRQLSSCHFGHGVFSGLVHRKKEVSWRSSCWMAGKQHEIIECEWMLAMYFRKYYIYIITEHTLTSSKCWVIGGRIFLTIPDIFQQFEFSTSSLNGRFFHSSLDGNVSCLLSSNCISWRFQYGPQVNAYRWIWRLYPPKVWKLSQML